MSAVGKVDAIHLVKDRQSVGRRWPESQEADSVTGCKQKEHKCHHPKQDCRLHAGSSAQNSILQRQVQLNIRAF
jgi:hypothetical protein